MKRLEKTEAVRERERELHSKEIRILAEGKNAFTNSEIKNRLM